MMEEDCAAFVYVVYAPIRNRETLSTMSSTKMEFARHVVEVSARKSIVDAITMRMEHVSFVACSCAVEIADTFLMIMAFAKYVIEKAALN